MSDIKSKDLSFCDVSDLKNHPRNPNKHSKKQIDSLAKIIAYQGFRIPIITSKLSGYIVSGHGRLMAAKKLGVRVVPVIEQDFTNEEQEYAFMVSDNAIGEWSLLDLSLINSELANLGPDFDLEMLGLRDFKLDFEEPDPKLDPERKDTNLIECPNCGAMIDKNG